MDARADAEAAEAAAQRAARGNRGKRMRALMADEEEADEEFWNQDALAEEAEDEEYESESEEEDMVDQDFFREESSGDEGEAGDEPVEKKKKTLRPPGWVDPRVAPRPPKAAPKPSPRPPGDGDGGGEGVVSPSTRSVVHAAAPIAMRKSVREAAVIANEARKKITGDGTKRPQRRRKVGDEPALSQAQMLVEAAQTELVNLAHLAQLQAREDLLEKQRAQHVKKVYAGPKVRYVSTKHATTIEFTHVSRCPPPLLAKPPKPASNPVCAITGLHAKYRDPLTGLPYATAAAFKKLRANHTAQAAAAAAAAAASNIANASEQNAASSVAPASADDGKSAAAPVRTVIKCTLKLPARSAALANPNCPPQPIVRPAQLVVKPAQP